MARVSLSRELRSKIFGKGQFTSREHTAILDEIGLLIDDPNSIYVAINRCPEVLVTDPRGLLNLVRRYPSTAEGLIYSLGSRAVQLEHKHRNSLKQIARNCMEDKEALARLDPEILDLKPEVYLALSEEMLSASRYGFAQLMFPVVKADSERVITAIKIFGRSIAGIFSSFCLDFWPHYDRHFQVLMELNRAASLSEEPEYVFASATAENLEKKAEKIISLANYYGTAAGLVFRKFGSRVENLDKQTKGLPRLVRDRLGITHIQRYVDYNSTENEFCTEFLEAIVKAADDTANPQPLALAVYNQYDWNGGFNGIKPLLEFLSGTGRSSTSSYKLIINETGNKRDLFARIQWTGLQSGVNPDGTPIKPIRLLILGAHGEKKQMDWGHPSVHKTGGYLSLADRDLFTSAAKYIAPGATIVLHSCSTGKDGADDWNMATMIKSAIPQATIYAPTGDTKLEGFQLDSTGIVTNVFYNGKEGITLKLPAAIN